MKKLIFISLILFFFASCVKEKTEVTPKPLSKQALIKAIDKGEATFIQNTPKIFH